MPYSSKLNAIIATTLATAIGGCGSSNDSTIEPAPPNNGGIALTSPSGTLNSARPEFRWTALGNAESYRLVVSDANNNRYSRDLDPQTAGCQTGTGQCSATSVLGYFDNDLEWQIESTVDGQAGPTSEKFSITTPISPDIAPIKSSTDSCEAWPSVAFGNYIVVNNSWNSKQMNVPGWSQLIDVKENADGSVVPSWTYDWLGRSDGQEIEVKSYPEVVYGNKLGVHISGTKAETGLPELVSDLPEFIVHYNYTETGSDVERNVAIESFFHSSCDIGGPCGNENRSFEMMIWVNNPTIRTPGKLALSGIMIDDQLWNVYIKPNINKHYIAFTAQNPSNSGSLRWNRFVEWTQNWTEENATALQIDVLRPEFCMGAIEMGTETWWGAGSFTLNQFEVTR